MKLPKISVVTPSFNQGRFLGETILSVINQGYPDLEYIIIDGGSTDESIEIIKKYASHLSYWVSEKDGGQSEAINKGFKKCTGDIVAWLCSDDCYNEGTLHKVADHFSKNDYALVYGKSVLFGDDRKDKIIGLADKKDDAVKCLAYVPFPQPSTFFKRKVLLDQGYLNETLHYGMDHDLFARIALNYEMLGVDDVFSRYRYHKTSKSNDPIKFAEDWTRVFNKVLRSFPEAESLIKILKENGYYSEGTDTYAHSKSFTKDELQRALIYFLEVQMHYYYQALDLKKAKQVSGFLLNYDDQQVNKSDARKINLRAGLLNKQIISLMRKLTNK